MITKVEKLSLKIIVLREILLTKGCKHGRRCYECPFDADLNDSTRCNLNYELEQKGYSYNNTNWEDYLRELVEELIVS